VQPNATPRTNLFEDFPVRLLFILNIENFSHALRFSVGKPFETIIGNICQGLNVFIRLRAQLVEHINGAIGRRAVVGMDQLGARSLLFLPFVVVLAHGHDRVPGSGQMNEQQSNQIDEKGLDQCHTESFEHGVQCRAEQTTKHTGRHSKATEQQHTRAHSFQETDDERANSEQISGTSVAVGLPSLANTCLSNVSFSLVNYLDQVRERHRTGSLLRHRDECSAKTRYLSVDLLVNEWTVNGT
jgi:hypothetical protein